MKLAFLLLSSVAFGQTQYVLNLTPGVGGAPPSFTLVPLTLPPSTAGPIGPVGPQGVPGPIGPPGPAGSGLTLIPCTPPTQGIISMTVVTDAAGNTLGCLQNKVLPAPNFTGSVALTNIQPGTGLQAVAIPGNLVLNVDMSATTAPTSSSSTGVKGQWSADSQWFYFCVATNSWVRWPLLKF